jgi:hypothetical protein
MRARLINGLLVLTAVTGLAGLPAMAQAKHGADDPAGHNANDHRRGQGADDPAGHNANDHRRGRGADDAPGHT